MQWRFALKNAPLALALVLIGLAAPAFASDINGDDAGSALARQTLPHADRVVVFSVSNGDAILLHRNPDLAMDPTIAAAINRAGYAGADIIGYNNDGSSLTVYVKS